MRDGSLTVTPRIWNSLYLFRSHPTPTPDATPSATPLLELSIPIPIRNPNPGPTAPLQISAALGIVVANAIT